jgi:hypothetical protein
VSASARNVSKALRTISSSVMVMPPCVVAGQAVDLDRAKRMARATVARASGTVNVVDQHCRVYRFGATMIV